MYVTVLIEIAVCAVINTGLCVMLLSKDKNVQTISFEKQGLEHTVVFDFGTESEMKIPLGSVGYVVEPTNSFEKQG